MKLYLNTTCRALAAMGVATALAIVVTACNSGEVAQSTPGTPPAVILGNDDVAIARMADVASGVVVSGSLEPAETVLVKAQVPGTIRQLTVDRGVPVRRGQRLAVIEAEGIRSQVSGAQAALASARSSVAAAEAGVAAAKQKLEGARTLHQAGAMSTVDFQAAETQHEAAASQLAAAHAQVAAAQAQLVGATESARRTTVEAPISGIVSHRHASEGEAVTASQDLLTIVDPERLELAGQISVQQAAAVKIGQRVSFTLDAYPDQEFTGTVARIDPVADPTNRRVGVALQLPNRGNRIVGGQFVTGRVSSGNVRRAVTIPRTALRGNEPSRFVLVIEQDRVVRRSVVVESIDDTSATVPVRSGLVEGDRVIVSPAANVEPGATVRISSRAEPTQENR